MRDAGRKQKLQIFWLHDYIVVCDFFLLKMGNDVLYSVKKVLIIG